MPKHKLKQWLPTAKELSKHRIIAVFAPFLVDPRLWQLNRAALVRAIFIGVFVAFLPAPGQMLLALLGALVLRANIPMAVALTWLTNPLTSLPVFWVAYWVGASLLGEPAISLRQVGILLADLMLWVLGSGHNPFDGQMFSIKVFLLGLLVCATITSIVFALAFTAFWRYRMIKNWRKRKGYNAKTKLF